MVVKKLKNAISSVRKVARLGKKALVIANAVRSGNAPKILAELAGQEAVNKTKSYLDSRFSKNKGYRLAKGAYQTYSQLSEGNVLGGLKSGYALGKEIVGKKRSRAFESSINNYLQPNTTYETLS